MRDILFIRLLALPTADATAEHTPVEWLVRSSVGSEARCTTPRRTSLLAAATEAKQRQVVVIAPDSAVLLTQTVLPPRSGGKVSQIVPFLLEDQLAEDIHQSHFALGKATRQASGNRLPVAVVSDELMQQWQLLFTEASLSVDALVPAPLCLEQVDHEISVLIDSQNAWVRSAANAGYFCDLAILPTLLHGTVADADAEQQSHLAKDNNHAANSDQPTSHSIAISSTQLSDEEKTTVNRVLNQISVDLKATSMTPAEHEPASDPTANQPTVDVELNAERYPDSFTALANGWRPSVINLLQGDYHQNAGSAVHLKAWSIAAGFLLLLGAVATLYQFIQVNQLDERNAVLTSEINRIFLTVLPNSTNVDARAQVQQALNQRFPANSTDTSFLQTYQSIVTELAKQQSGNAKIVVQQLRWQNNRMELELRLPDVQIAEQLKTTIAQQTSHTVSIASVSAISGGYKVKLNIATVAAESS